MKFKVIILDFDGVLVESQGIKDEAFASLFQQYPEQLDEIMAYHRQRPSVIRFEKFRYIYERILKKKYTSEVEQRCREEFSNYAIPRIINCPEVAGAKEFLDFFSRRVPLYLVSVNPPSDLEKILEGRWIAHFFKKIYPVEADKKDALREILKITAVDPAETVFIGDTCADENAAKTIAIPFVGIGRRELFSPYAMAVCADLKYAREWLMTGVGSPL